jgi:hypothetical protein
MNRNHFPMNRNRFPLSSLMGAAALLLLVIAGPSAQALTWSSGNGTWAVGTAGWGTDGTTTWTNNNAATFAGSDGTYAITVGGPITVGANTITFSNDGYTLSADSPQTITIGSTTAALDAIRVSAGKSATIGTNVTISDAAVAALFGDNLVGGGGGTLNIIGAGATQRR